MIAFRNVRHEYRVGHRPVPALRGLDLDIGPGLTFIVGPSGSGKSTVLHLAGALDRPTSGTIRVLGRDLGTIDDRARTHFRRTAVGFVFQAFNLLPALTALENVLVPFLPDGVPAETTARARILLADVGLDQRMDHRPDQLSGGEQQRVAIARALLTQAPLVLADEPTGDLDTETGRSIVDLLRTRTAGPDHACVIVTHDLSLPAPGETVIALRDGRRVTPTVEATERT